MEEEYDADVLDADDRDMMISNDLDQGSELFTNFYIAIINSSGFLLIYQQKNLTFDNETISIATDSGGAGEIAPERDFYFTIIFHLFFNEQSTVALHLCQPKILEDKKIANLFFYKIIDKNYTVRSDGRRFLNHFSLILRRSSFLILNHIY